MIRETGRAPDLQSGLSLRAKLGQGEARAWEGPDGVMARLILALVAMLTLATPVLAQQSGRRVALVVANGSYTNTSRLENPANDGRIIADSLRKAGFTSVDLKTDQGLLAFQQSLRDFRAKADGADVALVYYAGHGIEGQGKNWLIPTDARLVADRDLAFEAVDLDLVMQTIGGAKLRVAVLDACRNNPFGQNWRAGTRAVSRGLTGIEVDDVLVIFAAAPGQTAADGSDGNSPFAASLARHLPEPGLPIQLLGGVVRDDVLAATDGAQRPFISASITGTAYYLVPAQQPAPQMKPVPLPEITMASADTSPPEWAGRISGATMSTASGAAAHDGSGGAARGGYDMSEARVSATATTTSAPAPPVSRPSPRDPPLSWISRQSDLAMSQLSVIRSADGTDYAFEVSGLYPVKRLTGKLMPLATYIRIQIRDLSTADTAQIAGAKQELVGSWQPGSPFSMSFRLPRALIDSGKALSVRLCMGAEKNCVFSPDLARPSTDAAFVAGPARPAPLARKILRRARKP